MKNTALWKGCEESWGQLVGWDITNAPLKWVICCWRVPWIFCGVCPQLYPNRKIRCAGCSRCSGVSLTSAFLGVFTIGLSSAAQRCRTGEMIALLAVLQKATWLCVYLLCVYLLCVWPYPEFYIYRSKVGEKEEVELFRILVQSRKWFKKGVHRHKAVLWNWAFYGSIKPELSWESNMFFPDTSSYPLEMLEFKSL